MTLKMWQHRSKTHRQTLSEIRFVVNNYDLGEKRYPTGFLFLSTL